MKRILVCTDFSTVADLALDAAVELARALPAAIDLVHVASIPTYVLPPPIDVLPMAPVPLRVDALSAAMTRLSERAERVRAAGIACETALASGNAHEELLRRAGELPADLIVLGTHGAGLRRAILGSVAERVVHRAACPVLVVPARRSEA